LALIPLCILILIGCKPVTTSLPNPLPVRSITASPTVFAETIPTVTPTPIPFLEAAKQTFINLNAITSIFLSEYQADIWVVGDNGFIAHRSSMGHITRMDSPVPVNLTDVTFLAPDNGWIVGKSELILHWDGLEWIVSKPAVIDSGGPYQYDFYSVAFSKADDGWAAGCVGSEGGGFFLVYHWDGVSWSKVSFPEDLYLRACVHDVLAISPTDVWFVGTEWDSGKEYGRTVHWNGEQWIVISELNAYNLYSISGLSSDNIWAITLDGIVLNWNGVEWGEKIQLESANIIHARASDDIFAVGNKTWHWNGAVWKDISLRTNLPANIKIMGIVDGPIDDGGRTEISILDSSGILYWFTYKKFE